MCTWVIFLAYDDVCIVIHTCLILTITVCQRAVSIVTSLQAG